MVITQEMNILPHPHSGVHMVIPLSHTQPDRGTMPGTCQMLTPEMLSYYFALGHYFCHLCLLKFRPVVGVGEDQHKIRLTPTF